MNMEDRLGAVVDDQGLPSSAINVFVTGQPGVGKSWLVNNAAKKLPKDVIAGFYTVEARNPKTGEKIGFDIETFSGERAPLSRMRRGCGPKVGKYYFALEDFERLALPLMKPTKGIKLHIVDEVGRMELQSERFRNALMLLLASPQTAVFGSLRAPRFGHDLPFVEEIKQREDTATLTLTKSNRDATAQKVESILMNIVGSASVTGTDRGSRTESPPRTVNDTNSFDPAGFLNSYCTTGLPSSLPYPAPSFASPWPKRGGQAEGYRRMACVDWKICGYHGSSAEEPKLKRKKTSQQKE